MVPGKHGMATLMLVLNEAEIRAEAIPVHMYQGKTVTKHMKYRGEKPTVMAHADHINETATLCLPIEEEWRQYTSEDHDIRYVKRILSGPK